MKNSQPWIGNVGFIGTALVDAVALLHLNGYAHLGIAPEHVIVRIDKEHIPRPVLLDLGIAAKLQNASGYWHRRYMPPAYTPPELLRSKPTVRESADVYGLGALFYEMLAGEPAVPHHLQSDIEVIKKALRGKKAPIARTDIDPEIGSIVMRAVGPADGRPQTVMEFATALASHFKTVPPERPKSWQERTDWSVVRLGASVLIIIALLFTTGLIFFIP